MIYIRKIKGLSFVIAGGMVFSSPVMAATKPPQFLQCAICHKTTAGEPSTIGPNLWGTAARPAGSLAGFNYSPAMKKAGGAWTRDRLIAFITNPRAAIPGNRMPFMGQPDSAAAAAIADYVLSLK